MSFVQTPEEKRLAGDRSRAKTVEAHKIVVEGRYQTMVEIAQRLGCSVSAATSRVRKARGLAGPLTWARLA